MVSIVVIAHKPLASALVAAAQHVYSRDPCAASRQVIAIDIIPDEPLEAALAQAQQRLLDADHGQGVLVLTDMVGGTPGNVANRLAQPGRVCVVAGVSLPMLLRSLCYGASSLQDLVEKALAGGRQGVQDLTGLAQVNPPPADRGACG